MRKRTAKGNVTAAARKAYGQRDGSFPIFDRKSASSALKLRGHADSARERSSIISRAAKFAPDAARRARTADRRG